jgi:hypothetical protein
MFKMLSGSFAIFVLSNHTTCCQTQTGATVPLKCRYLRLVFFLTFWCQPWETVQCQRHFKYFLLLPRMKPCISYSEK